MSTPENPLQAELESPGPTIAAIVTVNTNVETIHRINQTQNVVAEIRGDTFPLRQPNRVVARLSKLVAPKLLTVRLERDGGFWPNDEEGARVEFIDELLPHVDGVDVELNSPQTRWHVMRAARQLGHTVIASYHDMLKTPSIDSLTDIYESLVNTGADWFKIASMIRNVQDNDRMAELTRNSTNIITAGMIDEKHVDLLDIMPNPRVLYPRFGSAIAYGHDGRGAVAPGQMSYLELARIFSGG